MRWWMSWPGQALANTAILRLPQNLMLDEKTRLLDIGCGRGTLMRVLDDQLRCEVAPVGIDVSHSILLQALRDERNPYRAAGFAQGTGTALPLASGAFSLVTCGYLLKHLADDEVRALFMEIHRVLEPGGLAVIWEFGPSGHRRLDAWNARVLATGVSRPRLRSNQTLLELADEVFSFARIADLRPFLAPPIPRVSILVGKPPPGFDPSKVMRRA